MIYASLMIFILNVSNVKQEAKIAAVVCAVWGCQNFLIMPLFHLPGNLGASGGEKFTSDSFIYKCTFLRDFDLKL